MIEIVLLIDKYIDWKEKEEDLKIYPYSTKELAKQHLKEIVENGIENDIFNKERCLKYAAENELKKEDVWVYTSTHFICKDSIGENEIEIKTKIILTGENK